MMKKLTLAILFSIMWSTAIAEELAIQDYFDLVESKGYSIDEKRQNWYQMIMAADGYGVTIDGNSMEIYEFDLSIITGRKGLENVIENGLMGTGVIVNGNLVMLKSTKHPKWTELQELFLSME
jgi:hypothetical protein